MRLYSCEVEGMAAEGRDLCSGGGGCCGLVFGMYPLSSTWPSRPAGEQIVAFLRLLCSSGLAYDWPRSDPAARDLESRSGTEATLVLLVQQSTAVVVFDFL